MISIEQHPQFLTKDDRREFAVFHYEEFVELEVWLRDAADLLKVGDAIDVVPEEPNASLNDVEKELDRDD